MIIIISLIIFPKLSNQFTFESYPLRTPRIKLSIKNEPNTINGMKYSQFHVGPRASFVFYLQKKKHTKEERIPNKID